MRKMATVRQIDNITPIDGADRIELAHIDGWQVIVGKGQYKPGWWVVYAEIDSAIPINSTLDPDGHLAKRGVKNIDGNNYHVLKTIRLRGQVSQGMIFPLHVLENMGVWDVGDDVSEELGIIKYDPVEQRIKQARRNGTPDANLIGPFPSEFARKSDSERVQNLGKYWNEIRDRTWLITEKVDGQSITLINDNGTLRVATRNWEVAEHPAKQWALDNGFLDSVPHGWAVQGEWAGPGVQGNKLGLAENRLFVFAVFERGYLSDQCPAWAGRYSVPVVGKYSPGMFTGPRPLDSVAACVEYADGIRSVVNPERLAEGVVFHEADCLPVKCLNDRSTFKAISNTWLVEG